MSASVVITVKAGEMFEVLLALKNRSTEEWPKETCLIAQDCKFNGEDKILPIGIVRA